MQNHYYIIKNRLEPCLRHFWFLLVVMCDSFTTKHLLNLSLIGFQSIGIL